MSNNDVTTQFSAPLFTFAGDAFDTDFDIGLLSEYLLDDEREQDDNNNDNSNLNITNNINNNVPYSNNNNIYNNQAFQLNNNNPINIPPFAGFGSEGSHSLTLYHYFVLCSISIECVYIDMYDDDDDDKSKFTFDDKNADQVGKRRYDNYAILCTNVHLTKLYVSLIL